MQGQTRTFRNGAPVFLMVIGAAVGDQGALRRSNGAKADHATEEGESQNPFEVARPFILPVSFRRMFYL